MVILSENEKINMCKTLAKHLPKLRELLGLSQKEFAERCGISAPRISVIENGHHTMSWVQFCSILFVCVVNMRTKEYFFANALLDARLLQFLQQKDENIMPDVNLSVDRDMLYLYAKNFNDAAYNARSNAVVPQYNPQVQLERIKILDKTSKDILFEYFPDEDLFLISYIKHGETLIRNEYANYFNEDIYKQSVHPDSCAIYKQTIQEATKIVRHSSFEYLSNIALKDYAWHRLVYSSVCDDTGKIISVVGRSENVDAEIRQRNTAMFMATTDLLTGLFNKAAFLSKVAEKLNNTKKLSRVMLMIDLDNFKSINDNYGHLIGDRILSETAKILGQVWNSEDIIGRFGGDEFVVYTESIDKSELEKKIIQVKRALLEIESGLYKITCSVGAYTTDFSESVSEMLEKADADMYKVKRSGRNGYNISNRLSE
ncbi:MAG: diguanylate cyclase [Oscillospiraceae bacterium]|nr:diguanylate cyclase [Oscillospiraceae bacterium]